MAEVLELRCNSYPQPVPMYYSMYEYDAQHKFDLKKKSYFDKACIHIAASSSSEHYSAVVKRVDITITVKITILDFLGLSNTVVCRLFSDFLDLEMIYLIQQLTHEGCTQPSNVKA